MSDPEKNSSLVLILLASLVIFASAKLGVGTGGNPGPGFLSFWAAIILALSLIIHLLSMAFSKTQELKDESLNNLWAWARWRKVIYVILALVIYTILFEWIGFILCTFFLMMFLLAIIEARRWYRVLIESVLITFLSYVFFEKGLSTNFPKGIFGF